MKTRLLLFLWLLACACGPLIMHAPHAGAAGQDHEDHATEDDHARPEAARISADMAERLGIASETVSGGRLQQTIITYGRLDASPDTVSHIRARFPGQIIQVYAAIGDQLQKGDLLAVVESNESLQRYQIRSPINGTVTRQHASSGDLAENQVLYEIADFSVLWAEVRVFPGQRHQLRPGMPVRLRIDQVQKTGELGPLIPSVDHSPYIIARTRVDNSSGELFPGLLLEAEISVAEFPVAVHIPLTALQTMQQQSVVFVRRNDRFQIRPVKTGRRDHSHVEIVDGLQAGEQIATRNSYLIRAELEKSGAEQHHH